MRYWQLNRCVFSCFLKTPSHVRQSQFSRQTVPNYRTMYSKATTAVNCPSNTGVIVLEPPGSSDETSCGVLYHLHPL